jgi:hypothetical protein
MLQFSEITPKLTEEVLYVCERWKAGYAISTRNRLVVFFLATMACFRKQKQASLSVRMSYLGIYRAAAVTKNITFQYKGNMYYVQLHSKCTL